MYKRILLKISGESIADKEKNQTINCEKLTHIASIIKDLTNKGIQVGIVIGAGNIWRGKFASKLNIDPAEADYMGMCGTVINAVALANALKTQGINAYAMSAINIDPITIPFDENKAKEILDKGGAIVFGGGTGKPFFTTDTAATLRAIQIDADLICMAKYGVDGVYTDDPNKNPDAKFIEKLTFKEILDKKLQIMDLSAVELIKDKDIEVRVFNMDDPKNIEKVVNGEKIGTILKRGF